MAKKKQVTAIIVGAGHRSLCYAGYSKHHPDKLKIVGVADPSEHRRKHTAEIYGLTEKQCFKSAEELAKKPKQADCIINGTMDIQHVPTSIPLLKRGYDILLEKPFATNEKEMWELYDTAVKYKRRVMICHVLRYVPFLTKVRELIAAGEIGEVMNIQTVEHVSYHHMGIGFVRGKWNREDVCKSTMLMSKCCHDLDMITWMKSGIAPKRVSSFGSNMYFNNQKMPKGAGTRCLVDCEIEPKCDYSAKKHYLDHPGRWSAYVWAGIEHLKNPSFMDRVKHLNNSNFGKCMWRCDNNTVDHQTVMIEFTDGCTASHNMVGGAAMPSRSIHLLGTHGEIQGVLHENKFVVRHIDHRPGYETKERVVDLKNEGNLDGAFGGHGGGDLRLAADFVNVMSGEKPSISYTGIEDSVYGHLTGFLADKARRENSVIDFPKLGVKK
ncbi:MAG: Gfo/Idh/MocA family oxidoreductase [Elusimicrobiota bacterium]